MALASLSFRARNSAERAEDIDGGVRLRGELEWFVSGDAEAITVMVDTLGPSLCLALSAGTALIRPSNAVGRFDIGSLGVLELRCGKWDESVFDWMLADLSHVATSLPFAADQAAGLPHDRALAERGDVLLHAFLYLRHIVLARSSIRALGPALQAVLCDPHRRFLLERESVPLSRAHRVDTRTFARLAAGAEPLSRVQGRAARSPLARVFGGYLPESIDGPRSRHALDTAENRFVLAFLDQTLSVVDRVEQIARTKSRTAFWRRIADDCVRMRRALRPARSHDIWDDVARMTHLPIASSVLQRRRGYREILQHYLAMRAATRLPLPKPKLQRLLGLKDVASLYELWCFFAVVKAASAILGRLPDRAESPRADLVQVGVPWGLKVSWGSEVDVIYNLRFSVTELGTRQSLSLPLRPDIVVHVRGGGRETLHVLDAKLRVTPGRQTRDEAANTDRGDVTFKKDDIVKMHAYRDALPHVGSAFVLYPGSVSRSYRAPDAVPGCASGVGAIALAPGAKTEQLSAHLALVLGDGESPTPRSRPVNAVSAWADPTDHRQLDLAVSGPAAQVPLAPESLAERIPDDPA